MSLHTHQTVNGETTAFKCYRSIRNSKPCVYVEVFEGYTTPGWAGGSARRTTVLRLTRETLEDLSHYFGELAVAGEADESPQNAQLRAAIREGF